MGYTSEKKLTVLVDPSVDVEGLLEELHARPVKDISYTQIIMEKDLKNGEQDFYSVEYWSSEGETRVGHLSYGVESEYKDVEVLAQDPNTMLENLENMGYEEVLEIEITGMRYKYYDIYVDHLRSDDGYIFLQAVIEYDSNIEEKRKTEKAERLFQKMGVAKENIFEGSVFQYLLKLKDLLEDESEEEDDLELLGDEESKEIEDEEV